jgi:hypothetical protein
MSSNRAELRDKFINALKITGKKEVTKGEIKIIMQDTSWLRFRN